MPVLHERPSFTVPVSSAKPRANCTHGWRDQRGRCMWCGDRHSTAAEATHFLTPPAAEPVERNYIEELSRLSPNGASSPNDMKIALAKPYSSDPLDCEEAEVVSIETVQPRFGAHLADDTGYEAQDSDSCIEPAGYERWNVSLNDVLLDNLAAPTATPAPDPIGPQEGV